VFVASIAFALAGCSLISTDDLSGGLPDSGCAGARCAEPIDATIPGSDGAASDGGDGAAPLSTLDATSDGDADAATNVSDAGDASDADAGPATTFTVGGTISGLSATETVTLRIAVLGGFDQITQGNGTFTFPPALMTGAGYTVTASTPAPDAGTGYFCQVASGGTGVIGTTNITNVAVACSQHCILFEGCMDDGQQITVHQGTLSVPVTSFGEPVGTHTGDCSTYTSEVSGVSLYNTSGIYVLNGVSVVGDGNKAVGITQINGFAVVSPSSSGPTGALSTSQVTTSRGSVTLQADGGADAGSTIFIADSAFGAGDYALYFCQ
jgi:hypothetical protein